MTIFWAAVVIRPSYFGIHLSVWVMLAPCYFETFAEDFLTWLRTLTPSLPQPVNFPGWKVHAKSIFSSSITNLISVLCILIKILSHAKGEKRINDLKFHTFIVRFQVNEGVKCIKCVDFVLAVFLKEKKKCFGHDHVHVLQQWCSTHLCPLDTG